MLLVVVPWLTAGPADGLAQPPNIVFILTDDEDVTSHGAMPRVARLIEDRGTTFDDAFVTYPLCCPARASILRGQYPHNTRILGNRPPRGGFATFRELGREESTVATWLQDAGYRTGFYGKYLNGYTEDDPPPPGWDAWYAGGRGAYHQLDYAMNENGRIVRYGDAPEDFFTDVIRDRAIADMRRFAAEGRPFFLHLSTYAPHSPYVPAPRHAGRFAGAPLPRPPSFDEADTGDKPSFVRELPRLSPDDIEDITDAHRRRLETLQAVDEMVEALVQTLDALGQLENTYLVYTSDNGFHLGQHRMKSGKHTPYEADIRVPLAVRGPGVPEGRRVEAMVLNTDLAPTFAAMAGIEPPAFVDGRSFLPLLDDPARAWREGFLIRRLGLERREHIEAANAIALRTERWTFVVYGNGERELYDLEADPDQLDNMIGRADPDLVQSLSSRLDALSACAGDACRTLEDTPIGE